MEQSLEDFRAEKDHFFQTFPDSPLTDEQKAAFSVLKYFPPNPGLKFKPPIDTNIEMEQILQIQTSAGDNEPYRRAGKIKFTVDGKEVSLTVFKGLQDEDLFLPFKDTTSGKETYGSGRYLEVEEKDGKLIVDFNYAYNPNCAYNPNWRCPLTPFENNLTVPIEAGEKKFHD